MAIRLYMDQHVPRAITSELRSRGVDVVTAYEDGTSELEDPDLLDRAGVLERVLFTRDEDLLAEATRRQRAGLSFYGVIYAHQLRVAIGTCIRDLEIISLAGDPDDIRNGVVFLPL
jgi:Domain of unknown function (DUF5615)